jgi:hypothetical protein
MVRIVTQVALLLALAAASPDAAADGGVLPPLRVQQHVTPAQAKLGEPFVVEVVVTHEPGQRYELPIPTQDLGAFEYVSQNRERVDGPDSSTTTFKVTLQGFELGKQRTPTLDFEINDPNGTVKMPVSGTDVDIVATLPADAKTSGADLYDVRQPEELPVRTWRLVWAVLIGLATALLAWGVFRWLRRPRPIEAAPARPPEPAHVRARQALDALAAQNLPGQGRVKEFYFRLSEIIRGYLGELYAFDALESTTPELLTALRSRATPGLPIDELRDFANESDFVRYAKQEPDPDACKRALEVGYCIVHSTTMGARPTLPTQAPAPTDGGAT